MVHPNRYGRHVLHPLDFRSLFLLLFHFLPSFQINTTNTHIKSILYHLYTQINVLTMHACKFLTWLHHSNNSFSLIRKRIKKKNKRSRVNLPNTWEMYRSPFKRLFILRLDIVTCIDLFLVFSIIRCQFHLFIGL